MTQVSEEQERPIETPPAANGLAHDLAESSSIWITTAVLILVILGSLVLFRFAPEIANFVGSQSPFENSVQ